MTFRSPYHSRKEEVNLLGPLRIKTVNKVALGKSHPCSTACLLIIQLQIWRRRVWHVLINVLLRASQARIREYGISIMNSLESKEEVRKRSKSDYPTEFLSRYLVTLYVVTLLESFFLLCMSSKGRKTQEVNSSSSSIKPETRASNSHFKHFPGGSSGINASVTGWIPGLARSPGEAKGNPLQYTCLKDPVDKGA